MVNTAATWKAKTQGAQYDDMRARLSAAAWDYASMYGLQRLTLNAVAAQAGCARSSVYRYFDNKEQLLGAVLQDRVYALGQQLERELQRYTDPREQLLQGLQLALAAVRAGPSLELIRTLLADDGQAMTDILLEYLPRIAGDIMSIGPVFQQARTQGLVRAGVSDEDVLRWLITIAIALVPQSGTDSAKERAYLRKMLLPSIFNT